mmetsp:Transcript_44980/g.74869  ORF Transcript_44980/g.74869 Transcript_44980/m.74869 type:complete len:101 (+) Transcript_44980:665-967(+)
MRRRQASSGLLSLATLRITIVTFNLVSGSQGPTRRLHHLILVQKPSAVKKMISCSLIWMHGKASEKLLHGMFFWSICPVVRKEGNQCPHFSIVLPNSSDR